MFQVQITSFFQYILPNDMNKPSRLDKLPQPLMLSRKNLNAATDIHKPYRLGAEHVVTQKSGLLSDMKQELSIIKDGVQKLLTTNEEDGAHIMISSVPEVFNQTLKDELVQAKQLEERLRKELQKSKSDHLKLLEEMRESADRRLEVVRRDYKEEKSNLKGKIQKMEQAIESLRQSVSDKDKENQQLRSQHDQAQSQSQVTLKLVEGKYQSALLEFKKLEQRFIKEQKGDLATVQHRLYQSEQEGSTLRIDNIGLKNQLSSINGKLQRMTAQCAQLRNRNTELQDKVRVQIKNGEYLSQIQDLKVSVTELESEKIFLAESLGEKASQYQHVKSQLDELNNAVVQSQQMHKQRLEIVNLEVEVGMVKEKCMFLNSQVEYMREVLLEKESYIEALEDQSYITETSSVIRELEERCQGLVEEKHKIVRDFEQAIAALENSERSMLRSSQTMNLSQMSTTRNNNFDEALKEQIRQSDSLRASLRQKSQQLLSMKFSKEELERRMEAMRNQFQMEKVKLLNEQRSNSKSLEYTFQSTKQQLEMQKRKEETLQSKLETKVDELKKKDEFIQKHLIGKIGRDQNQSETKYLAEQLQKFMSLRLQQSTFILEPMIKLDTPRMYKHPELLRTFSMTSSLTSSMLNDGSPEV